MTEMKDMATIKVIQHKHFVRYKRCKDDGHRETKG